MARGQNAESDVRSEPDTLEAARQELMKAGYNRVKGGAVNVPNFDKIETWVGRAGVVYLTFNEFGWDILASVFRRSPSKVEAVKELMEKLGE